MNEKNWTVYLSGEIHSDWRERIAQGVAAAGLPVRLIAPRRSSGPRAARSGTTIVPRN